MGAVITTTAVSKKLHFNAISIVPGMRFGKLVVVCQAGQNASRCLVWKCKCDCGKETTVMGSFLFRNKTKSCGCARGEANTRTHTTHGRAGTPEYTAWAEMKRRCVASHRPHYHNYGGRGIKVCERWLESFENFFEDMGIRPSYKHSLDKIDNYKGYGPDNCRWATQEQQAKNKRNAIIIEHNGTKMPIDDLADLLGINKNTLRWRYRVGVKLDDPVRRKVHA